MKINIKRINEKAIIPTYGSEGAAGCDIYACIDESIEINPGESKLINTGLIIELPFDMVGLVYARSGLATKQGLAPANKVAVIDNDYRGELLISLYNQSKEIRIIEPNTRIAQLVVTPYIKAEFNEVDELSETKRNTGGFGSTGTK